MSSEDRSNDAESGGASLRSVYVNGEGREVKGGTTVAQLVESLGRDPRTVAVELNGLIVPRDRYDFVSLQEGDRLEIVHFVQGG